MTKIWLVLSVIAALVISGCASTPENANEFDWCYIFHLNEAVGFEIQNGSISGQGLIPDADGILIAKYVYDRDVYNAVAYITLLRPVGSVGDIGVKAEADLFSAEYRTFGTTMPADVETVVIETRNGVNTEDQLFRNTLSIHAEVTTGQPLAVASVEVRGNGANPFPYNYCEDVTSTPTAPGDGLPTNTPTPSGTPTPTLTPTGTLTPATTPYPIKGATAVCSPRPGGWGEIVGTSIKPLIFSGDGLYYWWIECGANIIPPINSITLKFSAPVTGIKFYRGADIQGSYSGTATNEITFDGDMGSWPVDNAVTWSFFKNDGSGFADGDWALEYVCWEPVDGPSTSPCEPEGTPTPGPTNTPGGPTNTPRPTGTFEPLWGSCLDFTADAFGFSAVGATYNNLRGWVQSAPEWRIGRGNLAAGAKKRIKLVFEAGQMFSGQIRLSDNVAHFTSWKTGSGNSVIVDFSTGESWVPTSPFWVEFDGNNIPLVLRQLCWLDPNPSTATPGPGTGTPLYTRTPWALTVSPTYQPSRTPIVPPNPIIIITSTPGVSITTTPIWGGGYNPSTGIPPTAGTPGGSGLTDGTGLGDAGDMLGFAGEIGKGLLGAGGAYMGQVGDAAGSLLGAMTSSSAKPIGGLPLCVSNPRAYDICAIYWILDWTLFAPNTPGALIIPLLLILMNFFIVIRFVRWGLLLARRGESVTSVE